MRSILKYSAFAYVCSLLLMQAVVSAQTPAKTPDEKAVLQQLFRNLEIEFPEIKGWKKSEVLKYPREELGYSINYDSPEGGRVTVYVYDAGLKTIPNDINSSILKDEIQRAKEEIKAFGEAGLYENVKEIKNDTVTLGGAAGKIKALHSLFNFRAGGRDLTSEIFLFSYQNKFIKIRATRLKDREGVENKSLVNLFSEIDALFSI
jgi:hypothetical protein